MPCTVVATLCKSAAERQSKNLDLTYSVCARTWLKGMIVSIGTTIRPQLKELGGKRGACGFEFVALNDGQTGEEEPRWAGPAGTAFVDGSVTWHAQALSNDSLERTIVDPGDVTWSAPDGLIADGASIRNTNGQQQIGIFISGEPTDETENIVKALVEFSDGEELEFGIEVTVHDQAEAA